MQTPILFLMGPTAIGKTAAAITLATRFSQLSLISVDSAMVYRRMNIGTGKPDLSTLTRVPHRLIDIREPWETYSAANFSHDAHQAIADCRAQGKIPLFVGGTFLYFKALQLGLSDLPSASPVIRAEIQAAAIAEGWPALHAQLAVFDPQTARRLSTQDSQRITRAIEVYRITGRSLSAFIADKPRSGGQPLPGPIIPFVLNNASRASLHAQISKRFHDMMAQGFLDEVRALLEEPQIHPDLPAMRAVGYRQLIEYCQPSADQPAQTLEQAVERGIAATRQLAKRQLTWLRGLPSIPHFMNQPDLIQAIADYIKRGDL
jgi:tRNA dimethylallyltransferase